MLKRVIPNKGSYCYSPHDQTNTVLPNIGLEVAVHQGKCDFVAPGAPVARSICIPAGGQAQGLGARTTAASGPRIPPQGGEG